MLTTCNNKMKSIVKFPALEFKNQHFKATSLISLRWNYNGVLSLNKWGVRDTISAGIFDQQPNQIIKE